MTKKRRLTEVVDQPGDEHLPVILLFPDGAVKWGWYSAGVVMATKNEYDETCVEWSDEWARMADMAKGLHHEAPE